MLGRASGRVKLRGASGCGWYRWRVLPNILGLDVSGLDVDGFLRAASLVYPVAALCWLALLVRIRRPGFLLLGILGANAFAWLVTNYPLARLYALGVSADRLNNLAMCQVVASGHSPLETWLVGQTHFGPHARPYVMLWTILVSMLSGFDPERLLRLYGFLPLVMSCGFALALYFGLGPARGEFWSPWTRASIAGFATLMASAPSDFQGPYGMPWANTFLLKPNHALGLVLFPLVLRAFASIDGWRRRIGAGLLLHLLAWAFALHMAYFACGLVALVAFSLFFRREEFRRDLLDTLVVVGLTAAIVSPYLVSLVLAPRPVAAAAAAADEAMAGAAAPMFLEATLRPGLVFPAALWGAGLAWRRGGRRGRLLAAQLASALLLWLAYAVVARGALPAPTLWSEVLQQADEIFYWLRFVAAACAGIGAWDLMSRLSAAVRLDLEPAARAALLGLVCLPWSLPYWWDPSNMDRYFNGSVPPLPEELRRFGAFLHRETDPAAVLAGDPWLARYAAALAGRRSLISMGPPPPVDMERREEVTRTLLSGDDPAAVRAAAEEYGVTHIVITPRLLARVKLRALQPTRFEARSELRLVFASEGPRYGSVRVYRIVRGGPG